MRRFSLRLTTAAVATSTSQLRFYAAKDQAAVATPEKRTKMQTLHKLLTGEIQFKNDQPIKECYIEQAFGANWKTEFNAYKDKLPAEEKKVTERQLGRLNLTRYTSREIGVYGGNGPELIDAAAAAENAKQGALFLKEKGDAAFTQHVTEEAKNANWDEARLKKFVSDVKAVNL